jgi:hypothetical protein
MIEWKVIIYQPSPVIQTTGKAAKQVVDNGYGISAFSGCDQEQVKHNSTCRIAASSQAKILISDAFFWFYE